MAAAQSSVAPTDEQLPLISAGIHAKDVEEPEI